METNGGQRIRGVTDGEATGAARELFEASTAMLGRLSNLNRIIAHSPGLLRWWLPIVVAVRQPDAGCVSEFRYRNLAILKTSTVNGCHY
jgi:hypothetical protein